MSGRTSEDVDSVAVVGAGTTGRDVAREFAAAGYEVTLSDVDEGALSAALGRIEQGLRERGVEDPGGVLGRIGTTTDEGVAFAGADLVVEAVPEDAELKRDVLGAADDLAPPEAVLATTTATLSVTGIAGATDRPERVVGMRFRAPGRTSVVEVVRGDHTADEAFDLAAAVAEDVGRTPVRVERDVPGFLIDRVDLRLRLEAVRQVDAGVVDPPTIDAALRRVGFPMGPFEALDVAGIDAATTAARSMRERGVDLHVPDLLVEKVEAGDRGVETGEGFYEYPEPGEYARVDVPRERRYEFDPKELLAPAVDEAAWLVESGVATVEGVDGAMRVGADWPRGPLEFADEYGVDRLVGTLESLRERSGWDEYEPHPTLRGMVEDGEVGLASGTGFYEHEYERERFGTVLYERREHAAWVTLDRPDRLNALDERSWEGLVGALERAAADGAVRATVLRGAGRAFCAGDDIAEIAGWESAGEAREALRGTLGSAVETILEHPKPLVAAVDGVANGGGCELVLLADLAVAGEGSEFALPEARIGALPPIGLTYGRTSLGKKAIMELALVGDQLPASRAAEMGLVNYAVDGEQVEDVARELARSTTASGPESVATVKELWAGMEADLLEEWFDRSLEALVERTQSAEAEEGLGAFLEKRSPSWER